MKETTTVYRHRGLKCPTCGLIREVFGHDEAPVFCVCPSVAKLELQFDNLVTKKTYVEPYRDKPL